MNRIQLHKSIQHVTTANGKLSDKTIKLINKKVGFVRSVEGYIHHILKCVCIANLII